MMHHNTIRSATALGAAFAGTASLVLTIGTVRIDTSLQAYIGPLTKGELSGPESLIFPSICGDGYTDAGEGCDDANMVSGDGCSTCREDKGFTCVNIPTPAEPKTPAPTPVLHTGPDPAVEPLAMPPSAASTSSCDGTQALDVTSFAYDTLDPNGYAIIPHSIVEGSDGNLWFTDSNRNRIYRLTPDEGVFTKFQMPGGDGGNNLSLGHIAAGPDGNLWFAEDRASNMGRITPEGRIDEFPVGHLRVNDITVGPSGNIWYTTQGNAIGMMTMDGKFKEYPTHFNASGFGERNIAFAAGDIWYTDNFYNAIGRMDPTTGDYKEYPNLLKGRPWEITASPDGNVWVGVDWVDESGHEASKVSRITPSGAVTDFPLPDDSRLVRPGPDGNIYYTGGEASYSHIGNLDPTTGTATSFLYAPQGTESKGMTIAKDGSIWITNLRKHSIDRVRFKCNPQSEPPAPAPSSSPSTLPTAPVKPADLCAEAMNTADGYVRALPDAPFRQNFIAHPSEAIKQVNDLGLKSDTFTVKVKMKPGDRIWFKFKIKGRAGLSVSPTPECPYIGADKNQIRAYSYFQSAATGENIANGSYTGSSSDREYEQYVIVSNGETMDGIGRTPATIELKFSQYEFFASGNSFWRFLSQSWLKLAAAVLPTGGYDFSYVEGDASSTAPAAPASVCTSTCGDGIKASNEVCDDGNTGDGDVCSAACTVESPATATPPSQLPCASVPATPRIEPQAPAGTPAIKLGWFGMDTPGQAYRRTKEYYLLDRCVLALTPKIDTWYDYLPVNPNIPGICGDGLLNRRPVTLVFEECDDGNTKNGDGCSAACTADPGYYCIGTLETVCEKMPDPVSLPVDCVRNFNLCSGGDTAGGDGCGAKWDPVAVPVEPCTDPATDSLEDGDDISDVEPTALVPDPKPIAPALSDPALWLDDSSSLPPAHEGPTATENQNEEPAKYSILYYLMNIIKTEPEAPVVYEDSAPPASDAAYTSSSEASTEEASAEDESRDIPDVIFTNTSATTQPAEPEPTDEKIQEAVRTLEELDLSKEQMRTLFRIMGLWEIQ